MLRKTDDLQVHDLLQIDPDSLLGGTTPSWVNQALISCPWVVVRRARASAGEIAVGVRGDTRSQRWGGFLSKDLIGKVVRPADLLLVEQSSTPRLTPAIKVLQQVIDRWRDLTLPWGPTGSVGFELAMPGNHHEETGPSGSAAVCHRVPNAVRGRIEIGTEGGS